MRSYWGKLLTPAFPVHPGPQVGAPDYRAKTRRLWLDLAARAMINDATKPLVLASASPRRRRLLAEYGYPALIAPTQVEESTDERLSVRELVLLNAQLKSAAQWARHPRAIVLGTDTLVCLDGHALGKPADLHEAAAMLGRLAGRWHEVYSGVCLACPAHGQEVCFVEETRVRFHPLTQDGIAGYLRLIDPLDKAGGYAAQEHGERIIASFEGSWTNVLGLPMERLATVLAEEFGILPDPALAKRDRHPEPREG